MNWLLRFKWFRRWRGIPERTCACSQITAEAMRALDECLTLASSVNRCYEHDWTAGKTISIRRPQPYVVKSKPPGAME